MNGTPLLLAIIGHLVGDYLLQNDWMAQRKKLPGIAGDRACTVHCIIWSASCCTFAGWWASPPWIFIVLAFLHYWQDRTNVIRRWMEFIGQDAFASAPLAPWSVIVVDNVWHIVSLWAVWRFFS